LWCRRCGINVTGGTSDVIFTLSESTSIIKANFAAWAFILAIALSFATRFRFSMSLSALSSSIVSLIKGLTGLIKAAASEHCKIAEPSGTQSHGCDLGDEATYNTAVHRKTP
jgi:hypothetical protein